MDFYNCNGRPAFGFGIAMRGEGRLIDWNTGSRKKKCNAARNTKAIGGGLQLCMDHPTQLQRYYAAARKRM